MKRYFGLPATDLHGALRRYALWLALIAALLLWAISLSSGTERTLAALSLLAAGGSGYCIARTFSWVEIDPEGITGLSLVRPYKTKILWSEGASLRSATYAGIPCICLWSVDGSKTVVIPLSVAKSQSFHASLSKVTEDSHPLRRVAPNAA